MPPTPPRTYSMPILTLLGGLVAATRPRRVALIGTSPRVEVLRDSITYSIRDQRLPVPEIHVWNGGPLTHADLLAWGRLDVLWLDAGDDIDDARHLVKLWPHLAPGCVIVLPHAYRSAEGEAPPGRLPSTECDQQVPPPTPLWQELRLRLHGTWDVLGLPYADATGLALLRKHYESEVESSVPFEQALVDVGKPPIRIAPAICPEPDAGLVTPSDVCRLLADPLNRAAFHRVCDGATTLSEVEEALPHHEPRAVKAALSHLTTVGLVRYEGTSLVENTDFWASIDVECEPPLTHFHDNLMAATEQLPQVAGLLPAAEPFTEEVANDVCSLFTRDPAFLRRELVDRGLVQREGGRYTRPPATSRVGSEA